MDCDEDDASAYRRLARLERRRGQGKRAQWLEAEARAFKRMANQWLPRFDLLLAASDGEAHLLRARAGAARISVVPNTIPPSSLVGSPARRAASKRRDIVFVGNMNYLPNIDAVRWFALCIWPKIRAAVPCPLRFVVVGSDPPPSVTALARRCDIVVTGTVEDVSHFYCNAALAVAPIRAGGGTRIKLLESAGLGIPMVATSFGCAGTGFRHGVDLLLADNENDFAAACVKLLTDKALALRFAERASKNVRRSYDARKCTQQFLRNLVCYSNLGVFADGAIV
jgi:glycosyltransferase involved in cell wall biosynthesis